MDDPYDTKLAHLSQGLRQAAKSIFQTIISEGYLTAKADVQQRHFERTGKMLNITIAGPTTPVDAMQALFEELPDDRRELVRSAGRVVYAQHAADGGPLSDYEAFLTVLAGSTTWDKWDMRGGGCHWHSDMYPDPTYECGETDCDGWIEDTKANVLWCAEAVDAEGHIGDKTITDDTIVGACHKCKRQVTWAEFKETTAGQRRLASGTFRESILAPWQELGLLEPHAKD